MCIRDRQERTSADFPVPAGPSKTAGCSAIREVASKEISSLRSQYALFRSASRLLKLATAFISLLSSDIGVLRKLGGYRVKQHFCYPFNITYITL